VVLCDWGYFNCAQLKFLRKRNIPVLYYFPPRSWQRHGNAGLGIVPLVDRVATPFDWSARRLISAGCDAEWVGHPLLESRPTPAKRLALRREFGVRGDEKLIALLPGSRIPEINVLAPRVAEAAQILRLKGKTQFVATVSPDLVQRTARALPAWVKVVGGRSADALAACDAAIVKTGTATLEATVLNAPQVAIYDFDWVRRAEWIALWAWKRIPFIAMPNIILQRMAIPELLGFDCNGKAIAEAVSELLENDIRRHRMLADYDEIRQQLGSELPGTATQRAASIIEEMLGGPAMEVAADGALAEV
jgi:lipid-A-disaccharide synthase